MVLIFNIRLVIFIAIVLFFIIKNVQQINKLKILRDKTLLSIFSILAFFVLLSIASGYYNGHGIKQVFFDANAYFYLLYLPIWYQVYDQKYLKNIFKILEAAVSPIMIGPASPFLCSPLRFVTPHISFSV